MENILHSLETLNPTLMIADILLVAFILLFAVLGARKGLVLTLCSLVSIVLGFLGGSYLANLLTPPLAAQAAPMLESFVSEQLSAFLTSAEAAARGEGILAGLLLTLMEDGLTSAEPAAAELASALAEAVIHPILFLITFLLILIAGRFVAHALDLVARLPVLSTLNSMGGFLLGVLKGILLLLVLVPLLLHFFGPSLPPEPLEHSVLLPHFQALSLFF